MTIDLVAYLSAGGNSPRLWVDFNAYAKKLLLGSEENPWTTPAAYMAFYGQAHGLVSAEVVVINVWDMFQHWFDEDKDALPSMAGQRRATVALKTMLEVFPPRELLAEVITAMSNNYGGAVPMVLVMPSPRSLLVKAHKAANGVAVEPDEMNVDTASMYVADYLRYFSATNLSGVLLVEDPDLMPASGEELGWYQPVYNVASHYRWSVGVQLPVASVDITLPEAVDFAIAPKDAHVATDVRGTDITQPLWGGAGSGGAGFGGASVQGKGFYYVSIPADSKPETVLETLSNL
ncbi:MAG: hypothetical protein JKY34_14530, partial [Kordiimonadaceae bacterium]|nr:hypothetical protein [Kordiimonadaceae bacterium]